MSRVLSSMIFALMALLLARAATAADTVYYYYTDSLHSAVAVTDAQGNVIERTYYAPYGQVLNRDLRDGPGYTGHEEDPETNLVYMQQRYYDPEAGRFLSTDPVQVDGNGGSFNRYEYANDNPYRYTDPFGMCTGSHLQNCPTAAFTHIIFISPSDSSTSILRHPVKVSYASGTSAGQKTTANNKIASAARLLNTNADKFSYGEKQIIRGIDEIHVDPTASRSSVDVASGTFKPNAGQLAEDTPRFATDIAHDAYHVSLYRSNLPYAGTHAEGQAIQFQLEIGSKIGLGPSDTSFLQNILIHIQNYNYWNSPVTH